MDNGQEVIIIAHPAQSSGELKILDMGQTQKVTCQTDGGTEMDGTM